MIGKLPAEDPQIMASHTYHKIFQGVVAIDEVVF
jgi:hypothetical protein